MKTKLTLQQVLETHRITCAEMDCRPDCITGPVARACADQVAEDDAELGAWLRDRAEKMDQPVTLSNISTSLQQHGVR